jgi:hypothetical protein
MAEKIGCFLLALAACAGCAMAGAGCAVCRGGAAASSAGAACESEAGAGGRGVGAYFRARANDLADVFGLSFSLGFGVLANVRATQAIQCGGLFHGGARFGFIGREAGGWSETAVELGIPGFYLRSADLEPANKDLLRVRTERGQSLWQFLGDEGVPYDTGYDRKFWQVGATVHAGIVGVDFSVNLKELVDFLLGWGGLDLSGDDAPRGRTAGQEGTILSATLRSAQDRQEVHLESDTPRSASHPSQVP